ncbi:hypothetical protein Tco_0408881 [Tanacetum coccineum]
MKMSWRTLQTGEEDAQIDEDEGITLVQMSARTQGRHEHDFEESNFEFIAPEEDYTVTAEPVLVLLCSSSTDGAKKTQVVTMSKKDLGWKKLGEGMKQLMKKKRQRIARVHEKLALVNR